MPSYTDHPARERRAEAIFEERKVRWEFHSGVPISDINLPKTMFNQSRGKSEGLNREYIEHLVLVLNQGTVLPALVIRDKDNLLVDGYHRIWALRQVGLNETCVYRVDVRDNFALHVMQVQLNTLNGLPISEERRKELALGLLARGMGVEAAAAATGLTSNRLKNYASYEKLHTRLRAAGVPEDEITLEHLKPTACGEIE